MCWHETQNLSDFKVCVYMLIHKWTMLITQSLPNFSFSAKICPAWPCLYALKNAYGDFRSPRSFIWSGGEEQTSKWTHRGQGIINMPFSIINNKEKAIKMKVIFCEKTCVTSSLCVFLVMSLVNFGVMLSRCWLVPSC